MKKTLLALMVMVLALGLPVFANGTTEKKTMEPTKKILRFAQQNPKVGLDEQTNSNSKAATIADLVTEGLYHWNEDNQEILALAADWPEISADGLTYTFKLKQGVMFSDGTPLTSEDVKFTFERMFTPSTAAVNTYMFDMIAGSKEMMDGKATGLPGFKIIDDYTFSMELYYPFSGFLKNMGLSYAEIFPSEACTAAGNQWGLGTNLVGTGPYMIKENDGLTKVVLVKNPNYRGNVNLDEINIIFIDDDNTKMMEYEAGNIDLCQLSPAMYQQYKDSKISSDIYNYTPLGTVFVNLNLKDPALQDVRVREALSLAIDRISYCEDLLDGAAVPATGYLNPSELGYMEREPYEFNLAKAKQLLADAGATDLHLTAKVRAMDKNEFVYLQSCFAQIGVTMDVQVIDAAVWASEWRAGSNQIFWMGWFPLYADADNHMYTYFYSENAAKKSSFYNNAEFDEIMNKARQMTDDAARAKLYQKADTMLSREDYGCIPLYYPKYQFVAKPYVKNMKVGNLVYHLNDVDIDTSLMK
jgi:peptide/nickel transport system substrate-binding protein